MLRLYYVWFILFSSGLSGASMLAPLAISNEKAPWHLTHDTIGVAGIAKNPSVGAHHYPLAALAPKQGKGIRIAFIDTGLARHPDLPCPFLDPRCCYNAVAVKDLYHTLQLLLAPVLIGNTQELIIAFMPFIIKQYLSKRNLLPLIAFIFRYAKPSYKDPRRILSRRGLKIAKQLAQEIESSGISSDLVSIGRHSYLKDFLPFPATDLFTSMRMAHGTHACGLINAHGPVPGIAPNVELIMIRAFDNHGTCTKSLLTMACLLAQHMGAHVVNLSVKLDDHLNTNSTSTKRLESVLATIPYVIAAAGNKPDPSDSSLMLNYPARFDTVDIAVGSHNQTNAPSAFSQHEPSKGPHLLAPGEDVVSTVVINGRAGYLSSTGTSVATALVSGLFALLLAECGETLSREQLLTVLFATAHKIKHSKPAQACLYGNIDIRAALFVGLVLCTLKSEFPAVFDLFTKDALVKNNIFHPSPAFLSCIDFLQSNELQGGMLSISLQDALTFAVSRVCQCKDMILSCMTMGDICITCRLKNII